jgi:hypothetical protein
MAWAEAVMLYHIGAALVLAYLACCVQSNQNASRVWMWLKPLFLFASLLILVVGFAQLRNVAENANAVNAPSVVLDVIDANYRGATYVYITFGLMFIISFLYELFMIINFNKKQREKNDEGDDDGTA